MKRLLDYNIETGMGHENYVLKSMVMMIFVIIMVIMIID
jgi:hypothetical protein